MPRGLLEALESTVKGWTRCLGSSPGSQLGKGLIFVDPQFSNLQNGTYNSGPLRMKHGHTSEKSNVNYGPLLLAQQHYKRVSLLFFSKCTTPGTVHAALGLSWGLFENVRAGQKLLLSGASHSLPPAPGVGGGGGGGAVTSTAGPQEALPGAGLACSGPLCVALPATWTAWIGSGPPTTSPPSRISSEPGSKPLAS